MKKIESKPKLSWVQNWYNKLPLEQEGGLHLETGKRHLLRAPLASKTNCTQQKWIVECPWNTSSNLLQITSIRSHQQTVVISIFSRCRCSSWMESFLWIWIAGWTTKIRRRFWRRKWISIRKKKDLQLLLLLRVSSRNHRHILLLQLPWNSNDTMGTLPTSETVLLIIHSQR